MSKKKKKIIIVIMFFLVLVLAAGYTLFIKPALEKEKYVYEETQIYAGTLQMVVSESGALEFETNAISYDVDISALLEDEDEEEEDEDETVLVQKYLEIEEMYVAAGSLVSEGDHLLKFSPDSIEAVRKLLQNALAEAQSDYVDAEREYQLGVLEAELTYQTAVVTGNYAERIYGYDQKIITNQITQIETEIASATKKKESLAEAVTDAQESYNEAYNAYQPVAELYEAYLAANNGAFSNASALSDYTKAQQNLERAASALEQAKSNQTQNLESIASLQKELEQMKALKNIYTIEAAQSYEQNKYTGENAQLVLNASKESLKSDLLEAEEEKLELEEKLQAFEELVGEDGILRAPSDGLITETGYSAGDELEGTGNLFVYTTKEQMSITVDVTQEDVVFLSVGDSVSMEFNAYEGEVFQGTIVSIDTTATSADTPTVSYQVKLHVNGELGKLYGGMTAKIAFVIDDSADTIYISRKSLVQENGQYYVYVKDGLMGKELRQVEVGLKNESYVEILSGLTTEDVIYIRTLEGNVK